MKSLGLLFLLDVYKRQMTKYLKYDIIDSRTTKNK